jgi:hypothetical protein
MPTKKNCIMKMKNGKHVLKNADGKEIGTYDSDAEALKNSGSDDVYRIDEGYEISVHHDDEHLNARDFPAIYYCRHMEPGLCGYEKEKILVDADAMKNMNPTFAGKPVYVGHQKVDVSKIQEEADGYVVESFYNELDGWSWAKFIVVSDKGKDAIARGWAVSNAYIPSEFASGGQSHAIDFERKIVNANYTHLAIVPDPRYEGAKIFTPEQYKAYCADKKAHLDEMKNSKGATKMFKRFFKSEQKEVTNANDIDDNTMVELTNGKSVSIKEMIETVELANAKAKKNEKDDKEDKKEQLNADTEVDVAGEKMPLSQLMNKYANAQKENEKRNADEAEAKEKKEKENKEKKNAEDKEKKDKEKEDDEKANAKTFEEMKNAKGKTSGSGFVQVDTQMDGMARGQSRYGSAK